MSTDVETQQLAIEAEGQLDYYIFRNIANGFTSNEDFEVTYEGDEFLVFHHPTGKMFGFTCKVVPSDSLSEEDMIRMANDQEWLD